MEVHRQAGSLSLNERVGNSSWDIQPAAVVVGVAGV